MTPQQCVQCSRLHAACMHQRTVHDVWRQALTAHQDNAHDHLLCPILAVVLHCSQPLNHVDFSTCCQAQPCRAFEYDDSLNRQKSICRCHQLIITNRTGNNSLHILENMYTCSVSKISGACSARRSTASMMSTKGRPVRFLCSAAAS